MNRQEQLTAKRGLILRFKSAIRNLQSAICVVLLALSGCHWPGQASSPAPASAPYQLEAGTPQGQAQRIIVEGLNDSDPRIRTMAIEVVSTTRLIGLMPKVQTLLADHSAPVRFLAAVAVGDMQYAPAQSAIAAMTNDPDANARMAAGYAMTKLGHPEYVKLFRDAITSTDQTVRANAALLLGKSGDPEARRLLYWALQNRDSGEKVVAQAIESIATLGDERIYPKIWTRLISTYADDRVAGVRAMGLLGTAQARNAIVTTLDDPVLEVRLAAAEQLGKLSNPIGEPEVQQVFDKPPAGMDSRATERIKILAASAIGEIATPSLTGQLAKLLADPSQPVRLTAAKAVLMAMRPKK
jgi:HEAT repeat protein